MLARQFRITKKEDFEAVYRRGRSFSLGMITMAARDNGSDLTRFGIVVSTKFSKYAVERNRIKRQIREIVRKNGKHIKSGYDIVFGARKVNSATNHTSREIENVVTEILRKTKLINEKKN
jgi:ribonuclease P protein component